MLGNDRKRSERIVRHRRAPSLAAQRIFLSLCVVVSALAYGLESTFGEEPPDFDDANWSIWLCSHPGATRLSEGALPSGDSLTGASISLHRRGRTLDVTGVQPDLSWSLDSSNTGLECEIDEHGRPHNCSFEAAFSIARSGEPARLAVAQFDPNPVPTERIGIHGRFWSIRVWLNRSMDPDLARVPCDQPIEDGVDEGPVSRTGEVLVERAPETGTGGALGLAGDQSGDPLNDALMFGGGLLFVLLAVLGSSIYLRHREQQSGA